MAIDPSLLVSAAVLQDYLVDNATGLPLADGTVTLYQDNSRTTFKNWYYLSGSPGSYTYITLPNPMTLSGVGTIQDGNGNDVIPFFYPYSETDNITPQLYYIVVTNSNGQQQFVRQNFPFGAYAAVSPVEDNGLTMRNYIVNNVFWRNVGSIGLTNVLQATLAPSAHDGFSFPDWQFIKQATGDSDTITFMKFGAGQFLSSASPTNQDVTPEYFMNFACTGLSGSPATYKYVQVPVSLHIKTLETTPVVLTIWYRCNSSGGTGGNLLTLSIFQFAGTGALSPMPIVEETVTMPISTSFTKQVVQFNMPSATGIATGAGGDDALYLQIGYPAGQTFNIDIAKVGLYIGDQIPANDCDLYDQVDTIITSPRTGDFRTSVNAFQPFGWVPMDDGTIGNGPNGVSAGSGATTRANIDTWPLYNLLWKAFSATSFVPIYSALTTQPYSANATTFGASAIADWTANKALALPKALGRFLTGTAPTMPISFTATNAGTNAFTLATGSLAKAYNGMPLVITNYSGSNQPFVGITYYISITSATQFVLYWDPLLGEIVTGTFGTGTITGIIPDGVLGEFLGYNFADGSGAYQAADGYPGVSRPTGALTSADAVRNPQTYMNFYIKL